MAISRRDLLKGTAALPLLGLAGCEQSETLSGEIIGPSFGIGHRLRDGWRPIPDDQAWSNVDVVIVGGGVAGLSAARELKRGGCENLVILELEEVAGGTSRSGTMSGFGCPWGAHYLPLPQPHQHDLIQFLVHCGVAEGVDSEGRPIVPEETICRDPEERLFFQGKWIEGLYPTSDALTEDLEQWNAFQIEVRRWASFRDSEGRRAFVIPTRLASTAPEVRELDQLTFADWLNLNSWTSKRLRWVLDYCCRDDYGLTLEQTSAWAGLFYFAARLTGMGSETQPLLTWPKGNGFLVDQLAKSSAEALRTGWAVSQVHPATDNRSSLNVIAVNVKSEAVHGWRAKHVIFACSQFLAPHLIGGYRHDAERRSAAQAFRYGSWLVANVALSERPVARGFPLAWDNVIYESPSLGYVVATHQLGIDHGPTVFTWYQPWGHHDPDTARRQLQDLSWKQGAEHVLADLEQAHPEIRRIVTRIDLMKWGHAMIAPTPGFMTGPARRIAATPWRGIHFANTDLSGVALFEEAFDHGCRAAREVIELRRKVTESAG